MIRGYFKRRETSAAFGAAAAAFAISGRWIDAVACGLIWIATIAYAAVAPEEDK